MSRRLLAVSAVGVALVATALALGFGGAGDKPYLVRAVFDNASFVVAGEDVKVAGVRVGAIDSLDLTDDNKAVVVLRIDDPAFRPFHADAHCRIALQSLIGEQFVDCQATSRSSASRPRPPLTVIRTGPGKGQHLLPVANTTTPVGQDLLNDIMRQPQRQRLRLIINELGAGLAANGPALRAALRRANPALQQADRVVSILAKQDELLAKLVEDSDAVLAPLAKRRKDLGGFIDRAGATAVATAQRGDDLEANFAKLPAFLRQLVPAAQHFGALADQMTPAIRSLSDQAPAVNAGVKQLGPFTKAATPALTSLGKVADQGRETFPKILPLAGQLGDLATPLDSLAANLAKVSGSFDQAGGIESVMRFIYYYTGTVNGKDEDGHYIRGVLGVNNCVQRTAEPDSTGCEATFEKSGSASIAAAAARKVLKQAAKRDGGSPVEQRSQAALLDYLLGSDADR